MVGSMDNGVANGKWTSYYSSGVVASSGSYKHGSLHGEWTYRERSGEIACTIEYLAGKVVACTQYVRSRSGVEQTLRYEHDERCEELARHWRSVEW